MWQFLCDQVFSSTQDRGSGARADSKQAPPSPGRPITKVCLQNVRTGLKPYLCPFVVDSKNMNLYPYSEFWVNLDPDPGSK